MSCGQEVQTLIRPLQCCIASTAQKRTRRNGENWDKSGTLMVISRKLFLKLSKKLICMDCKYRMGSTHISRQHICQKEALHR